jgi:AcrR family transcriptional regulator
MRRASGSRGAALRPPPAPGAKRPRGEQRREEIIAAAAELFRRKGYRGTSIEDIGAAVGTTGPALYRHFPSKEALLVELVRRAVARARSDIAQVRARGLAPAATLDGMVDRALAHALEESDLVAAAAQELRSISPEIRGGIGREQRTVLREWVAVLRALRPALGEREAGAVCLGAFALMTAVVRAQGLDPARARALYARMALAALLAGAAPAARRG